MKLLMIGAALAVGSLESVAASKLMNFATSFTCTQERVKELCVGCDTIEYPQETIRSGPVEGDFCVIATSAEDEKALNNMGCSSPLYEEVSQPFAEVSNSMNGVVKGKLGQGQLGYTPPAELHAIFEGLAADFPDVAQLIDVTETYKTPATVEGNHLYVLKISDNVAEDEDEPNVLVISNHHAREMITPEIAVTLAQRLVQGFVEGDEYLSNMVSNNQIYVAYTWNPDGLNHVWNADNNWRKNRSFNSNGSRGVDLNRNYPFGWDFTCSGSTTQTSQTYKGTSPGSEAETQTAMAFIKDRNINKYLDFHSSGRDVRYLYAACATMPEPLFSYYQDVAGIISSEMDYVVRDSCCTGGAIANAYFDTGAMSYLSETGTSFQPPAAAMREEVERVLPGAYKFIDFAMPVSGKVVDADTGAPIFADITLPGIHFLYGEEKTTFPSTGSFSLFLPPGDFTVSIVARDTPGTYEPRNFTVAASEDGTTVELALSRA